MNESTNELFGELRSALASGGIEPRELFWLLDSAYNTDPDAYVDQWQPYLMHCAPIEILITSLEELDRLPQLLPRATEQGAILRMSGHHMRKWHFQHIADSEGSWYLGTVDVSRNKAKNHYPASFAHSKTLINVHTLNLSDCDIHGLIGKWILRASFLASVKRLDLSGNPLLTEGMEALAQNEHVGNLEELDLSRCGISNEAFRALVSSEHLTGLKKLDVSGSQISKSGFIALASWEQAEHLEELELPWARIDLATRETMLGAGYFSDAMKDYIFEQTLPDT